MLGTLRSNVRLSLLIQIRSVSAQTSTGAYRHRHVEVVLLVHPNLRRHQNLIEDTRLDSIKICESIKICKSSGQALQQQQHRPNP